MIFELIISGFACYRLARLFAIDDGPFYVFDRIRKDAGRKAADTSSAYWKSVAEFLSCPYCWGFWIAFVLSALFVDSTSLGQFLLSSLGIAGIQAFLQGITAYPSTY